jgi:hypothetical protein
MDNKTQVSDGHVVKPVRIWLRQYTIEQLNYLVSIGEFKIITT